MAHGGAGSAAMPVVEDVVALAVDRLGSARWPSLSTISSDQLSQILSQFLVKFWIFKPSKLPLNQGLETRDHARMIELDESFPTVCCTAL